jgi:hypothetical protein
MAGPRLVFLYGPPAVGKLTVARAIAEREPFKVLHNHVTIDPVLEVLPFGTKTFLRVVDGFHRDLVDAAAEEGIDLIYTFVYAAGEEEHVNAIAGPYEGRGGSAVFVRLLASREVLLQRVLGEDRKRHRKLTDPATLEALLDQYDNFTASVGREGLTIDLGTQSAAEAADQVIRHLSEFAGSGNSTASSLRPVEAGDAVVLTVVSGEAEAEVVCGLLGSSGIECGYRGTEAIDSSLEDFIAAGSQEILVREADLEAARELLAAQQ